MSDFIPIEIFNIIFESSSLPTQLTITMSCQQYLSVYEQLLSQNIQQFMFLHKLNSNRFRYFIILCLDGQYKNPPNNFFTAENFAIFARFGNIESLKWAIDNNCEY